MNLRSADLNLLVTLQALLEEAHVTRAARRLGLSQPATSAALERCRHQFRDPLLIRSGGKMLLTPKGERLRDELAPLLDDVGRVLDIDRQDISQLHQTIRVSMSDSLVSQVAPRLAGVLQEKAPNTRLVFLPWFGPGRALDQIVQGEVDIAVSQFPNVPLSITRRMLRREDYRVAMRSRHPAAKDFCLESWLDCPQIMVSGQGEFFSSVDQVLAAMGLSRKVSMVVPLFNLVPDILRRTDLVAMLPFSATGGARKNKGLVFFEPPVAMSGYDLHVIWHKRLDQDAAVGFIGKQITVALQTETA